MIKFQVLNRFSGALQFEAEIECAEDAPLSIKLGLAVKWGVKAGANLAGANLAGANLTGANLAGANLAGAYLADANLARANLAGAYLAGAYLAGAYLADAYLAGAYLAGAKWRDGIVISQRPLQLYGLTYPVTILDQHMQIGCELHSLHDWNGFDDKRIIAMDGATAARFWRDHKEALIALAKGSGRSFEPVEVAEAA